MHFKPENIEQPIYIKSFTINPDTQNKEIIITNNGNVKKYESSLIVLFDNVIEHWEPRSREQITKEQMSLILDYNPEIILIGTGNKLSSIEYNVLEPLYISKIPFEVMSTVNACRTYNLLASELRKVAAALII